MSDYPNRQPKEKLLMREEEWQREANKKKSLMINLFGFLVILIFFNLVILFYTNSIFRDSPEFLKQNTSNVSNSMSVEKVIAWFCAGAFGYAAFYAIGKNIAEK